MLKLKQGNVCPPDKFTFKFPQDGRIITAFDQITWFDQIDKHYKDNQYEQPDNWREIAEDQLCRRLSGEWCIGGGPHSFVNTRFTINDFINGTKVLAPFVLSGQVVSQEVADHRAMVCSRCPVNVRVPGCASCTGMANAVAASKGSGKTQYDHLLQACAVCHCSNEAQVWIPAEYLKNGVTPEMMETYKEIDESGECWKYTEILALSSKSDTSKFCSGTPK